MRKKYLSLPLLPLRDVVIYPNMVVPLFVGRELSIKSLDDSMKNHQKNIVLVTQKSAQVDDPEVSDLYKIGTVANILQLLKLPDGTMKVLVEGTSRVEINKVENNDKLTCTYTNIDSDNYINNNQYDIGEPIIVTDFYKVLQKVKGIVDVVDLEIVGRTGTSYSQADYDFDDKLTVDGRRILADQNTIFELKFPNLDIKGSIQ